MKLREKITQINPALIACLIIITFAVYTIVGSHLNTITTTDTYLVGTVTLLSVGVLLSVKRETIEGKEHDHKNH